MVTKEMLIRNELGLHARPASVFVQAASKYNSSIKVEYKNKEYNAKSILSILSAGITCGNSFTLIIDGEDEEHAMNGLDELIESKFGES